MRITAVAFVMCAAVLTGAAQAEPPRVVQAIPDDGQTEVDPALREMRITFDQPMSKGGYSIVGGGPNFPKILGQPKWVDDRTLVVRIQLQPDHDYAMSINNASFQNFKNMAGESAVPYPIRFTTAAAKRAAPASAPVEANRRSIEQLRQAIDRDYSYRDLHAIDWDKLFAEHDAKLAAAITPAAFAREAARLLAPARDLHLFLKAGDSFFPTHRRAVPANINFQLIPRLVPDWQGDHVVGFGQFDDGIGYILIGTFERKRAVAAMERAYRALAQFEHAPGIIIDVRPNSGGDELLAREFARCFVAEPKVYSKNTIRRAGNFLGPFDRVIEPAPAGKPRYRGNVVVLMGRQNMSSTESFLLMMREAAGARLIGERSYGSSGNPQPHELDNGATVFIPSWQDMLPDGAILENKGIDPDVNIGWDAKTKPTVDPILDAALKELRATR